MHWTWAEYLSTPADVVDELIEMVLDEQDAQALDAALAEAKRM